MKMILAAVTVALCVGCGSSDSASYQIHGAIHSLALLRTKQFMWDKNWELALVTARSPECMRRHKLQLAPDTDFKAELFRSLEGNYILKQGNNWYVTETQKCQLQQFKQPPREPGDLLGTFNEKEGTLQFVVAGKPVSAPAAAMQQPQPAVPAIPSAPPVTTTAAPR
ncbi:MAG: hypothetical protein PHQ05_11865 [Sterolibacterium sp.]|nr:hypothetical protein [Sterolibacterium sp.]